MEKREAHYFSGLRPARVCSNWRTVRSNSHLLMYRCSNQACNWRLGCSFWSGQPCVSRTSLLYHVPECPHAKEREAIPGFIRREAAKLALNAGEPTSRGTKLLCSIPSKKTSQSPNIDRKRIYNTTYYYRNVYSLTSSKQAEFLMNISNI